MPRPDPTLLDPARYPFRCEIGTRFSDLDINMHVNNVALVEFLQEARVRFHGEGRFNGTLPRSPMVIASFAVEYIGEGLYGTPLTGHVGVLRLGRTSHTIAALLTQGDNVIAFARSVLVCMENKQPVPAETAFRHMLQSNMVKQ